MGELMNGLLRQRLVGLAVLLAAAFLLSLLLPGAPQPDEAEPTTTVSITGEEQLTEADAVPPPDDLLPEPVDDSLPAVEPSVTIADVEVASEAPPVSSAPAAAPDRRTGTGPSGRNSEDGAEDRCSPRAGCHRTPAIGEAETCRDHADGAEAGRGCAEAEAGRIGTDADEGSNAGSRLVRADRQFFRRRQRRDHCHPAEKARRQGGDHPQSTAPRASR